jgi:phospholipase D-like protein
MSSQMILLLIPIILIEAGLLAVALFDLIKRTRVKGGNKWVWGAIIVFVGFIGPILYFLIGREEE